MEALFFIKANSLLLTLSAMRKSNYYTTSKIYCTFLIACRMACGDGSGVRSLLS